jgi:hypothetical protein
VRKRLHGVHQRTMPCAAIKAHACAGASAWSQIGGPSGVRNLREEYRSRKRNALAPVAVYNVSVGTEDEGLAGQDGLDSSTFSLIRTHPPFPFSLPRHMLVGRPRRDSKTLSNATT